MIKIAQAKIELRKLMQWKDRSALKTLVDNGYLIPFGHACNPGECWKCDCKTEGLLVAIWWRIRYR